MMTATSPSRFSTAAAVLLLCLAGIGGTRAEPMPDSENGRYVLSPVTDGVIKLDTRTGDVSTCGNSGTGWACYAVPDERAALDAEIGRLQAENEKLKAQLAAPPEWASALEQAWAQALEKAAPHSNSWEQEPCSLELARVPAPALDRSAPEPDSTSVRARDRPAPAR